MAWRLVLLYMVLTGFSCGALSSVWFSASWWGFEGGDWVTALSWPLTKLEVFAKGGRTHICGQLTVVTVSGRQQRALSSAGEMPAAWREVWIPKKDGIEG